MTLRSSVEEDPFTVELASLHEELYRLAFIEPRTPAIERTVREKRERVERLIARLEATR